MHLAYATGAALCLREIILRARRSKSNLWSRAACQDGPQRGQGEEYLDALAGDIHTMEGSICARLENILAPDATTRKTCAIEVD